MKGRRAMWFAICALSAFLAGCSVDAEYLKADRATFDAIAPRYRSYIESDQQLEQAEKARLIRTVESWRMRLEAAERKGK